DAGIAWAASDSDSDQLRTRATARVSQRQDDIDAVHRAQRRQDDAHADRDRTADALRQAEQQLTEAQDRLQEAESALERAGQQVATELRGWADRQGETLRAAAGSELAAGVTDDLLALLPGIGTPDGGTLTGAFDERLAPVRRRQQEDTA